MSSPSGSTKVIVLALLANLGIAVAKLAGFAFSQSASMLAEAIHSLVDCSNQALLLWGAKASARPPDDRHPLGYGREIFFWSFVVAILLFSLGGLFAIYEGIHKLNDGGELAAPWVGIGVLAVAILLEAGSFAACLKEVSQARGDQSLWSWFRSTTAAELLVVFTEDAAALIGLALALACLVISWVTGDIFWDALGSILVGTLLVLVAVLVAVEIQSLLIGEAPSKNYRPIVERILACEMPGARVLRFIALQTGSSELMMALKIDPGAVATTDELIARINSTERQIKSEISEVRWLFVEPDRHD